MIPFNHLGWVFNRVGKPAYPAAVIALLCECLQKLPAHGRVLDLGAGTGVVGRFAHDCRADLNYVAADPAEGMLKYIPAHVERVHARAETLPFEDASFDMVMVGEALHHFEEPDKALETIARVLKENGVLFIYEFDPGTLPGRLICLLEKMLGEPGHFYPPGQLAGLLESYGLSSRIVRHGWRYTLTATRERAAAR